MSKPLTPFQWFLQAGPWVGGILSAVKFGGFWLTVGHFFCGWLYVVYYLLKYGWH